MLIQLLRLGLSAKEILFYALVMLFAMTLSFSVHEFMHAAVAVWLGDDTPRLQGRLTLNPASHVDPMGTILLLVAGFGWGKPVVFNPSRLNRFKSGRLMNIMVALAGVTGNFILALISSIIYTIVACVGDANSIPVFAVYLIFYYTAAFSMMLLGFNLIPIPPLDGFHVLEELLPYRVKYSAGYRKFLQVSPMIIWVVFLLGMVSNVSVLSWLINIIEWPFNFVINLICNAIASLF